MKPCLLQLCERRSELSLLGDGLRRARRPRLGARRCELAELLPLTNSARLALFLDLVDKTLRVINNDLDDASLRLWETARRRRRDRDLRCRRLGRRVIVRLRPCRR
eukprot:Amastigsp_a344678_84.p4 type:complete len:106 gc:universal Amastigsp_a344678_84:348-31(-)